MKKLLLVVIAIIGAFCSVFSQSLEQTVQNKIEELNTVIEQAVSGNIDVRKERMAIRVAEVYLFLANWDEANKPAVKEGFEKLGVIIPKDKTPEDFANELPDWQRTELILMLDARISELNNLVAGNGKRKDFVPIQWDKLEIEGARIIQNGQPIFGNDWTFKGEKKAGPHNLQDFFGALDGDFFDPNFLRKNNDGSISLKPFKISELNNLDSGNFGSPFIGGNNLPSFIIEEFPDITIGKAEFIGFDINHPQIRPLFTNLLNEVVPKLAGKNRSKLGYTMANEPHWNTLGTWDIVDFSAHTRGNFATWLADKHTSISQLNSLWATSHTSFEEASNDIDLQPSRAQRKGVSPSLIGTPKGYDFFKFNQIRANEWFLFLRNEILRLDPNAKTHIKLIPFQWTSNDRGSGLDFETLIGMNDVIGHDAHMDGSRRFGSEPWQDKYSFDWLPLTMSHDFFHSIKPNAINYNSETHMLFNVRFREAYLRSSYVRASHWMATLHGMDMSLNWVWARNEDGSSRSNFSYATTVGQQPRTLFELHSTILDLNSYALEISELQELKNPIRIFYSETSAINKNNHMTGLRSLYENLYFEGYRLGFATEDILNTQFNSSMGFVVVTNTEFVKESEIDALQNYLDNGGTVLVDNISLKKNEYGENHTKSLVAGSGQLIALAGNIKTTVLNKALAEGYKPLIAVSQTNQDGSSFKTIANRSMVTSSGKNIISLVNTGKSNATITLALADKTSGLIILDLLRGNRLQNGFIMEPEQVLLLELSANTSSESIKVNQKLDCLKLNGEGSIRLDYKTSQPRNIHIDVQDLNDFKIIQKTKETVDGEDAILIKLSTANELLQENQEYRLNIYMTEVDKGFDFLVAEIDEEVRLTAQMDCINNLSVMDFNTNNIGNVYPIPLTDKLNVPSSQIKGYTSLSIVDLNGRVLLSQRVIQTGNILEVTGLQSGIYFLQFVKDKSIGKILKLVK